MSDDLAVFSLQNIRSTDSNSLLRLYDRIQKTFNSSASEQERTKADKTMQRIAKELHKRKIVF